MNLPDRSFDAEEAVRKDVPLLFGVFGAPGAGKTPSSIRIGTGIREVFGGDLWVIDTEAGRALAYAEKYKFKHVPMSPPHGSLHFLRAMLDAVTKGARVIVSDTFSHEHSGIGGMLDMHEAETGRLMEKWKTTYDKASRAGWASAKEQRKMLINHIEQLSKPSGLRDSKGLIEEYARKLADVPPVAFVFSFRAKEKSDQTSDGKYVDLGYMPETDQTFLFMLSASALLLPRSKGKPTWKSDKKGEDMMIRLPDQFAEIFKDGRQLDERHGREMAEWSKGSTTEQQPPTPDLSTDEKVAALKELLKTAPTIEKLEARWGQPKAQALRTQLSGDVLTDLEWTYASRNDELKRETR